MKTGNGKIANLPDAIRDELNYRLTEGEEGIELVKWLNSKPEVLRVLRQRFDGKPISEQNLSQWRTHGYRQWHAYHNIVDSTNELTDNAEGIAETGIDCDKLLLTLTASYADMIQRWITTPCEEMTYKLAVYKNITNGVIALRRAEIQKVRLEIERERLELLREKRRDKSPSSSPASNETASSPGSAPASRQSDSESRHAVPAPTKPRPSDQQAGAEPPRVGSGAGQENGNPTIATPAVTPTPASTQPAIPAPPTRPGAPAPRPVPSGRVLSLHPLRIAP